MFHGRSKLLIPTVIAFLAFSIILFTKRFGQQYGGTEPESMLTIILKSLSVEQIFSGLNYVDLLKLLPLNFICLSSPLYVVMIDAGSTGSRVHVYSFKSLSSDPDSSLSFPILLREDFEQTIPGLSAYSEDPELAASSLDPLLKYALGKIPRRLHRHSLIAVKATAGLRLLGPEVSESILKAIRVRLHDYPFKFGDDDVTIMDGTDEGVFAWITLNSLLGNISGVKEHLKDGNDSVDIIQSSNRTAAIFDLGGGSTQIVFEPNDSSTYEQDQVVELQEKSSLDHRYILDFAAQQYVLYQHSHLGYGLMEARKKIHDTVAMEHQYLLEDGDLSSIINPCIAPGFSRSVTVNIEGHGLLDVEMVGDVIDDEDDNGTQKLYESRHGECIRLAEQILNRDSECVIYPCSFNGVHQPSIIDSLSSEDDLYIFSYFYDRTFPLGMPPEFSLKELYNLTSSVCRGPDHWQAFSSYPGALEELQNRPEWCLDLSFIFAILHTGYGIPLDRKVRIAKKIDGNELGWCLGAALELLEKSQGSLDEA